MIYKKSILITSFIILLALVLNFIALGWGFWAHKKLNRMAVFTLHPDMIGFYKKHIDFITENAVNPDKRRYAYPEEAPRHYIDMDRYGLNPFDSVPKKWNDAVAKYGEDTLLAHGIVPWHIEKMYYRLVNAFKEQNTFKILNTSADIGHYIGDAHVPLHCTSNYNGQLSNQHGIHGFWESRLPEFFGEDYNYFTGRAFYIKDLNYTIWQIIEESFNAVDSVLAFEKDLNDSFSSDQKYAYEQRGGTTVRTYSKEYSEAYDKMLNGMVERRARQSIIIIGSIWFSAWVDAGQPDLEKLSDYEISDEIRKQIEEEEKMWRTGKVKNHKGHTDE